MSSVIDWQTDTSSPEQTERLAKKIGNNLKGNEVIELVSDLGGGKTTFVRGLARGIGSKDMVSSPTFKINNLYHGQKFDLHHFDFYRLTEPGIMMNEIAEVIDDHEAVVVIEWANIISSILPKNRLSILLSHRDEQSRHLDFSLPPELAYLMKGII